MTAAPASVSTPEPVSPAEAEALFGDLAREPALLVAVSGGPDSVALLALLAEWAGQPERPKVLAATVDHGLRAESAGEAEAVAELCSRLGISHSILSWLGPKPATGLQNQARNARYRLLAREAERHGATAVVTAHTLDDQAETMLMRMAHGSGPAGLAGMRARSRRQGLTLARPLLGVSKARLIATAQHRGLGYASDPSNADTRFERVRWRALMPMLAQAGLDAGRMGLLATRMARIEAALAYQAEALWPAIVEHDREAGGLWLRFHDLRGQPEEITLRLLARAVKEVADDQAVSRLERLEACGLAFIEAVRNRVALTRTLSGCLLSLDARGMLGVRRERERQRGIHPAAS